ncbi:hypothetical protein AK830_g1543 [Neonectria ditissima]|uniref:Uncharacterized protein n=1 Tax=Neonectria ditissima TaxID=78410 RepID=A0A0P7B5W0_9HYPO|nr:hypothetical protein AK830_g1543 [Neonectria ditissima]
MRWFSAWRPNPTPPIPLLPWKLAGLDLQPPVQLLAGGSGRPGASHNWGGHCESHRQTARWSHSEPQLANSRESRGPGQLAGPDVIGSTVARFSVFVVMNKVEWSDQTLNEKVLGCGTKYEVRIPGWHGMHGQSVSQSPPTQH